MNPDTVRNWICKADNDLHTGKNELSREEPIIEQNCMFSHAAVL